MDLTIRPIDESEVEPFRRKIAHGFGGDPRNEDAERFRKVFERERMVAAFDGAEIVGTCGAFSKELTVPGGSLPMGGTTIVSVQPTHRRRGVLTAMMRAHLHEVRQQGEPLAGLWASESSIYGRFGFGAAAEGHEVAMDTKTIEFTGTAPEGQVRLVDPEEAEGRLPAIYEAVRRDRPGMLHRHEAWWRHRFIADPKHWRRDRSARRFAVREGLSASDGYAIYRQKEKWEDFPCGEVHVVEVVAATDAAHEALWRYLLRIDLFPDVRYWNAPVDDELPWRITDPRRVARKLTDSLWIRPLDIPRALEGRRYAGHGRLVLEVDDAFLPELGGRFALVVDADGATCRRSDDHADLSMSTATLGSAYLGGHRPSTLARAGLIAGTREALLTADRLFSWPVMPWCPEVF